MRNLHASVSFKLELKNIGWLLIFNTLELTQPVNGITRPVQYVRRPVQVLKEWVLYRTPALRLHDSYRHELVQALRCVCFISAFDGTELRGTTPVGSTWVCTTFAK